MGKLKKLFQNLRSIDKKAFYEFNCSIRTFLGVLWQFICKQTSQREITQRKSSRALTSQFSLFNNVQRLLGSLAAQIEDLDWQSEKLHAMNEEIDEAGDYSVQNSPSILQPTVFVRPSASTETTVSPAEINQRFRSVSDEETAQFVISNRNQNTVRKTCGNLKILNAWLKDQNERRQVHEISPDQLNKYLARYFLSVVKQDGTEYEPESLRSHLGSFSRHLKEKNYAENIMESDKFKHTRDVLASKMKDLKKKGLGNKKRKSEALENDDFEILHQKNLLGTGNSFYFVCLSQVNSK